MRWYKNANEDADFEQDENVFDDEALQEAYDRGFSAGYKLGMSKNEDSLDEGFFSDMAKNISNKDFYNSILIKVQNKLEDIVANADATDENGVIEAIKDDAIDSLNPVFTQLGKDYEKDSKLKDQVVRLKKNGLSYQYIGYVILFCKLTNTQISEFIHATRRDAEALIKHFQRTAVKFWDDFFKQKANRTLLQAALA